MFCATSASSYHVVERQTSVSPEQATFVRHAVAGMQTASLQPSRIQEGCSSSFCACRGSGFSAPASASLICPLLPSPAALHLCQFSISRNSTSHLHASSGESKRVAHTRPCLLPPASRVANADCDPMEKHLTQRHPRPAPANVLFINSHSNQIGSVFSITLVCESWAKGAA